MTGRRRLPNILFLMADQQKATSLPCYGNAVVRSPVLDGLAARGVVADQFYIQNPLCAPSRAAFHTGRYPHASRMHSNGNLLPADEALLAEALRDHPSPGRVPGYQTGAVGHVHKRNGLARGFDFVDDFDEGALRERWLVRRDLVRAADRVTQHMVARLPFAPDEDVDGLATTSALGFLEQAARNRSRPFFLHVAWIDPHPPYFAPSPYAEMYDPAALELPPPERSDGRKPPSYRATARDSGTLDAPESERRAALAHYYGMCSYLDDQAGRLLHRLRELGLEDDTIVVYTSDHGDYAGEHAMFGKSTSLYDCLVRVPLIIAGPPDLVPQGKRLGGFVESVDLVPTLLELTGARMPERANVHGQSLYRLWERGASANHVPGFDAAYAVAGGWPIHRLSPGNVPFGCPPSGRQAELMAMVRTGDWKYVHGAGRDVQELYNLASDPWELDNLWGRAEHDGLVTSLRERVLDWLLAHT